MPETINVEFNPKDLPRWAQNDPNVIYGCEASLAFRINVFDAKTPEMRHYLKREAERLFAVAREREASQQRAIVLSESAPQQSSSYHGGHTTGTEAIIERDNDGTYRYVLVGVSEDGNAWESDDVTGFASEQEAIDAAREYYRAANEE